jgi:hypothetical protein
MVSAVADEDLPARYERPVGQSETYDTPGIVARLRAAEREGFKDRGQAAAHRLCTGLKGMSESPRSSWPRRLAFLAREEGVIATAWYDRP